MSPVDAVRELRENGGTQFAPAVVAAALVVRARELDISVSVNGGDAA